MTTHSDLRNTSATPSAAPAPDSGSDTPPALEPQGSFATYVSSIGPSTAEVRTLRRLCSRILCLEHVVHTKFQAATQEAEAAHRAAEMAEGIHKMALEARLVSDKPMDLYGARNALGSYRTVVLNSREKYSRLCEVLNKRAVATDRLLAARHKLQGLVNELAH